MHVADEQDPTSPHLFQRWIHQEGKRRQEIHSSHDNQARLYAEGGHEYATEKRPKRDPNVCASGCGAEDTCPHPNRCAFLQYRVNQRINGRYSPARDSIGNDK